MHISGQYSLCYSWNGMLTFNLNMKISASDDIIYLKNFYIFGENLNDIVSGTYAFQG